MLDALQDHHLGGAVDPADRAPVAVPDANPMLMAAQRSSCGMRRERVSGKSLDPEEKRPLVTRRQCRKIFGGARRHDQPHANIIAGGGQTVNENCR
jgi:hypothetical protein